VHTNTHTHTQTHTLSLSLSHTHTHSLSFSLSLSLSLKHTQSNRKVTLEGQNCNRIKYAALNYFLNNNNESPLAVTSCLLLLFNNHGFIKWITRSTFEGVNLLSHVKNKQMPNQEVIFWLVEITINVLPAVLFMWYLWQSEAISCTSCCSDSLNVYILSTYWNASQPWLTCSIH
jgi:hypothetical protein